MNRFNRTLALVASLAALNMAAPAFAKPVASIQPALVVSPNDAVCVRALDSLQCGRHQQRLLLVEAQRAGARPSTGALQELGRRQLAALVDSVN